MPKLNLKLKLHTIDYLLKNKVIHHSYCDNEYTGEYMDITEEMIVNFNKYTTFCEINFELDSMLYLVDKRGYGYTLDWFVDCKELKILKLLYGDTNAKDNK